MSWSIWTISALIERNSFNPLYWFALAVFISLLRAFKWNTRNSLWPHYAAFFWIFKFGCTIWLFLIFSYFFIWIYSWISPSTLKITCQRKAWRIISNCMFNCIAFDLIIQPFLREVLVRDGLYHRSYLSINWSMGDCCTMGFSFRCILIIFALFMPFRFGARLLFMVLRFL